MKTTKIEKVLDIFRDSYNCSQALFSAFAVDYGLDEKTARHIASGFGAGMGCMQKTCGAVTGAFMAIGLKCGVHEFSPDEFSPGESEPGESDPETFEKKKRKEMAYRLTVDFTREFIDLHDSVECRELLGVDMNTPEGMEIIKEENRFVVYCEAFVASAAEILEELLE